MMTKSQIIWINHLRGSIVAELTLLSNSNFFYYSLNNFYIIGIFKRFNYLRRWIVHKHSDSFYLNLGQQMLY